MKALIKILYPGKYLICLFTFVLSLASSQVSFGQAPDLGTSSSFTLFTAAGAFTNTGTTTIWGDVGTFVGEYSGSPTVIGMVHVADSISEKAATDVSIAYTYMADLVCDSIIITPFGDGLVLLPGKVYCITTAAALNGNLILDAKGDSNAIFIIKVNGVLSTATNSNVVLINAASSCNVYWQVGGAVNLGIHSTFKGTILADGAISLLDSASLEGRGLSRAGAISLYNNQAIGCGASGLPVPIVLLSFEAQSLGLAIQLNWSTASETNNDYFTIQRSDDAVYFQDVICVQGAGNSNSVIHYMANDQKPFEGDIFYRLMQTDFDGATSYSDIIVINYTKTLPFTVFPNPFSTSTNIVMDDILQETMPYELKIYSVMGVEVMSVILTERITTLATDDLLPGIYLYSIIGKCETIQSGRLVAE